MTQHAASDQSRRIATGGRIHRDAPCAFRFDGIDYTGYAGDTLASALLANGVRLVARSFKYHRPRGIFSAGPEEPNALVQLRRGGRTEPNTRMTMIELFDGLVAESQNRWPSLAFDVRAAYQTFAGLMPAGFYYKTFMWPKRFWMFYERQIRKAAGMGRSPLEPDPDCYALEYAHCDVLIIGSGPAGLSAALAAARTGCRVVIADERAEMGGSLLWDANEIDGISAAQWAARVIDELHQFSNVRLLPRSTAFGYYDHDLVAIVERVTDHLLESPAHVPRQRMIHLRARRVVMATGSIERPLIFPNNDRPGVMLASAIRHYITQYAVLPGPRIAIYTNNDDAYRSAFDAKAAGADVVTVIDARAKGDPALVRRAHAAGIACMTDARVTNVEGKTALHVSIGKSTGASMARLTCDVLGTSGGWNPTVHLYSQSGGKLQFDDAICSFVPHAARAAIAAAGAANGELTLRGALEQGHAAGVDAAALCGFASPTSTVAAQCDPEPAPRIELLSQLPEGSSASKGFVDLQDDVAVEDIELAHRENFCSIEHLKRYTTLGMGTDQGKTSNVNGLAILAALREEPIAAVGTTTFRPPYTPVAMGAFAGAETGLHGTPTRRTALHDWHVRQRAPMTTVGHWLRPKTYQREGESFDAAWRRENLAVRNAVGVVDVGTLGKIDLQGPDAREFLQRVYCNNFATLAVGRVRYGLMLREDGLVMDDGTVACLSEDHYLITTTTVNAAKVLSYFEWLLQVAWPRLRCHAVSVTEQFAQFALAGPQARAVLARLLPHCDVSDAALPHLGILQADLEGVPLNVYRMSYSGERAYEIAIGADHGEALWMRVLECGAPLGIAPYGTEAMGVLRIEKGHVTGNELDGRTTAADVGMGRLLRKDGAFIGAVLARRDGLVDALRPALVGLVAVDGKSPIRAGSHLVADEATAKAGGVVPKQGYVSSSTPSEYLGQSIALAFVERGTERHGEELVAASPLSNQYTRVRIVAPVFVDPDGARMKG